MKLLKKLLFVIISGVALVLVIALFAKKEFTVEKKIVINVPSNEVFNYLKFLKHQDEYNVWQQLDKNKEKIYQGEDGTIGFTYTWQSKHKDLGSGVQEISKLVYPERIETIIRLPDQKRVSGSTYFNLRSMGTSTEVTWGFSAKVGYPKNFMLLFEDLEERIGNPLERGLQKLKKQLEG